MMEHDLRLNDIPGKSILQKGGGTKSLSRLTGKLSGDSRFSHAATGGSGTRVLEPRLEELKSYPRTKFSHFLRINTGEKLGALPPEQLCDGSNCSFQTK